jgi:AcrR family transcriptional regulator
MDGMAEELAGVNTPVYGAGMNDRLAKEDWIAQGLRTLAKNGANALKVGPMAAKLKVSRGSFYWHFRDIDDFRAQLLQSWRERSTDQVIRDLDTRQADPDRLKQFMKRAFAARRDLDRAVRSWAAQDQDVARVVASVDASRVAYLAKMLVTAGVDGRQAPGRAAFLYWAYLGQPIVMDPRHSSIPDSAIDDIGELFER